MKFFCPICGFELEDDFNHYSVICPCCGNEGNFDDHIDKIDIIKKDENYYYSVLTKLKEFIENDKEVPKEIQDYLNTTVYSKDEAWKILRSKWVKNKCKWHNKSKMPKVWGREEAIRQLKNINEDIKEYL